MQIACIGAEIQHDSNPSHCMGNGSPSIYKQGHRFDPGHVQLRSSGLVRIVSGEGFEWYFPPS
jgi:hypothetical protein